MKRQLIALGLVLILVLPGTLGFTSPRQDKPDIQLSVRAGYNQLFREGQWIPIRVTVSNAGASLSGAVQVVADSSGGFNDTTYRTPVELPSGAYKQIFLYVSLGTYNQRLQVEIVDDSGDVIEQVSTDVRRVARSDILYAVVSDSPYGYIDLTGKYPGAGTAHQVNWGIEDIPPAAGALTGLDIMMFHDVDTGTMTTDQRAALAQWVREGGHLILAGGDSWQRTTAAFPGLLPVAVNQTETVDSLAVMGDYVQVSGDTLEGLVAVSTGEILSNARIILGDDDLALITRRSVGAGVVDFLAVDPNAEPLRSWTGKSDLWYALVASTGQQPSWGSGFNDWDVAREATLTTFNTTLPTLAQLCGFLALYVVMIGPLNYLILKRINKREWAWFTIPVLIVVFSALAYSVGINLRGNIATVSRLNVIRVWPDSAEASVDGLIGVQSPRRTAYDVSVERGFQMRTLPGIGTGLNVPVEVSEETSYIARDVAIDAGTIASFAVNGQVASPGVEAVAVWHMAGLPAEGADPLTPSYWVRVEGQFTNTLPVSLQDAVLLIKGSGVFLGDLDPGETTAFDVRIGAQSPAPLTLGDPLTQVSLGYSSANLYGNSGGGWCFSPRGLGVTMADVMRGERFPCSVRALDQTAQEIRRRYRLLAALAVDSDPSTGRDMGAYVFGWTDQGVYDVTLVDRLEQTEDTSLYIFELPGVVKADLPEIQIPAGLTTWTPLEMDSSATERDATPDGFRLSPGSQAAFQFMPMSLIDFETVTAIDIEFQGIGTYQLAVWDWDQDAWVPLEFQDVGDAIVLRNPDTFVGPAGAVNVRVVALDTSAYNQVDHIEVLYRGRLADELE